jgi:hypothetical protein
LWAVLSRLLGKPDSGADFQPWEGSPGNAVFVKVNLPSIIRGQESVTLARKDFAHMSLRKQRMTFYVASLTTSIILQPPTGCFERIINCLPEILMWNPHLPLFPDLAFAELAGSSVHAWFTLHCDLSLRHSQIDPDMIWAPLPVVVMREFNYHATSHELTVKRLELSCLGTNPVFLWMVSYPGM